MTPSSQERGPDTEADVRRSAPGEPRPVRAGSRLFEREDELQRIAAAIALANAGSGGIVALEGSPGIGKTRLLQAAMELAAANDVVVVSARGGQMETDFAFGVVRQLFEPVLVAQNTERAALLDGAAAAAARLLAGGAAEPPGGGDRGFATLHALYRLTANLARRVPRLMVVDDALLNPERGRNPPPAPLPSEFSVPHFTRARARCTESGSRWRGPLASKRR